MKLMNKLMVLSFLIILLSFTVMATDTSVCVLNGICEPSFGENVISCSKDCYCGDTVCHPSDENKTSCAKDCLYKPPQVISYCGDGTCNIDVNRNTCASDCGITCSCTVPVILAVIITLVSILLITALSFGIWKFRQNKSNMEETLKNKEKRNY